MEQNFHCTKSVVGSLELDERNKLFKICGLFGG